MKVNVDSIKQKTNKVFDKSKDAIVVAKENVSEKASKLSKNIDFSNLSTNHI